MRRRHAAEHTDHGHPVGQAVAGGQGVGTPAGEADDGGPVERQGVEDHAQVVDEVEDRAVQVVGRVAGARPVDADQAHAVGECSQPCRLRKLPARAGRAVQPHDRPPSRLAELGEPQLAPVPHGDGAFDARRRDPRPHGTAG